MALPPLIRQSALPTALGFQLAGRCFVLESLRSHRMNYTGLGIHLKVADIAKSRDFYEGVLGLAPARASGSDDFRSTLPSSLPSRVNDGLPGSPDQWNSVTYQPSESAQLEIGDGHPAVALQVFLEAVESPKISAMLHAESLLPLVREGGVRPSYPLCVYPWGTVELTLRDPDGFVIVVIAPATEAEVSALAELLPVVTF